MKSTMRSELDALKSEMKGLKKTLDILGTRNRQLEAINTQIVELNLRMRDEIPQTQQPTRHYNGQTAIEQILLDHVNGKRNKYAP